jgi:O-antigen/teichoic acid export membrane protein
MSDIRGEVQRHGTMYLVSSLGITFIGFLATIFYAHWVGASVLGVYTIFLASYSILTLITDFGIVYAGTQRICGRTDPDTFFTASLAIRIGIYLLLCTGLILFRDRFADLNQTGLFWVLLAVVGITVVQTTFGMAISASNRLGLAASTTLINNIVRIVIQVIAVFLGFQVWGLVGGLVAGILVEAIIEFFYVDYHLKKFEWSHVRSLFSFSSWAFLTTTATVLFDNANILIIAYFMPVSDVGIYGVCWTFSVFALFVSTALCNTLYVKVSRWNATGETGPISASLSRSTTYALILALPMLVGGFVLGKQLLYYVYGASFAAGATALVIIIAARIFQSVYQLYSTFLMATDHVRTAFYGLGTGITVNLIASIILVPVLGMSGAAIASLLNVLVCITVGRYFLGRIIPVRIERGAVMHIVIATVIMTVALLLAGLVPVASSAIVTGAMVILGAAVYFLVLLILNRQLREDALRTLKIQWIPKQDP